MYLAMNIYVDGMDDDRYQVQGWNGSEPFYVARNLAMAWSSGLQSCLQGPSWQKQKGTRAFTHDNEKSTGPSD